MNATALNIFQSGCKRLVLALALALTAFSSGAGGNEYEIKAMFLYNFTKYAEWPDNPESTTFRVGVIGRSEIFSALEEIAIQKKVQDKKMEILHLSPEDDVYCQIIFVSGSALSKLESIEKKFAGKGVLIVTDESNKPAPINLITLENKIRFEINQTLVKSSGVKLSSQLLSLAVTVHP